MGKCDWCGGDTTDLTKITDLGNQYNLCRRCLTRRSNRVCRVCKGKLGNNSIMGICLGCVQLGYTESLRDEEEAKAGVDAYSVQQFSGSVTFTEQDFNDWMTFGQGNFTPARRTENRKKWLIKRFEGNPEWTKELIEFNIASIEKIMDRNFSKLQDKRYTLKILTGQESFKRGAIVDMEKNILLVDTQI